MSHLHPQSTQHTIHPQRSYAPNQNGVRGWGFLFDVKGAWLMSDVSFEQYPVEERPLPEVEVMANAVATGDNTPDDVAEINEVVY